MGMISTIPEYLYTGGDLSLVKINGEIMPRRSPSDKVLRGEDITFLIEALGERRGAGGGWFSRKISASQINGIISGFETAAPSFVKNKPAAQWLLIGATRPTPTYHSAGDFGFNGRRVASGDPIRRSDISDVFDCLSVLRTRDEVTTSTHVGSAVSDVTLIHGSHASEPPTPSASGSLAYWCSKNYLEGTTLGDPEADRGYSYWSCASAELDFDCPFICDSAELWGLFDYNVMYRASSSASRLVGSGRYYKKLADLSSTASGTSTRFTWSGSVATMKSVLSEAISHHGMPSPDTVTLHDYHYQDYDLTEVQFVLFPHLTDRTVP